MIPSNGWISKMISMNIKYSTTFKKQYKKAPAQIQKKIKARLEMFVQNLGVNC